MDQSNYGFSCGEQYTHEDYEQCFRYCGECLHVYRTEQELVDMYNLFGHSVTDAEKIYSCPCCIHDF
jgi:hypothetical protein